MVKEHLKKYYKEINMPSLFDYKCIDLRPPIICKDGFCMSVQASENHYCEPMETLENCDYTCVEVGFPNKKEELLMPYAENISEPTKTVYGWTPIEIVEEVIKKHGGIDIDAIEEFVKKRNIN